MQVKKFEATSLEIALAMVKREMGPNALILSTEQKKRKWYEASRVEVTAAHESKPVPEPTPEVDLVKVFPHRKYQLDDAVAIPKPKKNLARYIEVENKQRTVVPQPPAKPKALPTPVETELKRLGFSDDTARDIAKRVMYEYSKEELETRDFFERAVAKLLTESIRVYSFDSFVQGASWIPVGLSGAGKTTVAVKLALALRSAKKGVVLVSQDERKVVARNELANYARLIRVPFSADAKGARLGKSEMVDTPALSFVSDEQNREIERIQADRHSFLVLDASQRLSEMLRVHQLALRYHPACVVFTRLDTVSDGGALFDFLKITRLPLLGVSLSASFKVPFKFFEPAEFAQFLVSRRGVA